MKSENNIPKFDLADQILAEQRKTASIKRKAPSKTVINENPGKKNTERNNRISSTTSINFNNGEQIIAEIVERDIKHFRGKRI